MRTENGRAMAVRRGRPKRTMLFVSIIAFAFLAFGSIMLIPNSMGSYSDHTAPEAVRAIQSQYKDHDSSAKPVAEFRDDQVLKFLSAELPLRCHGLCLLFPMSAGDDARLALFC